MLSTYLPFIKLSVVHRPLDYNVKAVAKQHSCVNSVMVQHVLMKYGNILNVSIDNSLWAAAAPLPFVHPRVLLCYNGEWWELLKKGCDIVPFCIGRRVGGWHLIRKHGRGGRRGSGGKIITELRSGWLFIAHKWDGHIITPPLQWHNNDISGLLHDCLLGPVRKYWNTNSDLIIIYWFCKNKTP